MFKRGPSFGCFSFFYGILRLLRRRKKEGSIPGLIVSAIMVVKRGKNRLNPVESRVEVELLLMGMGEVYFRFLVSTNKGMLKIPLMIFLLILLGLLKTLMSKSVKNREL